MPAAATPALQAMGKGTELCRPGVAVRGSGLPPYVPHLLRGWSGVVTHCIHGFFALNSRNRAERPGVFPGEVSAKEWDALRFAL